MNTKDQRLKLYIISCHVDKPLEQEPPASIYDCPIQAGATRTDMRTCPINDYDGFAESISDRNDRYSEATAMYWVGAHLDTPYVGFVHYRRRLVVDDETLAKLMEEGVDIITTKLIDLYQSIEQDYRSVLYGADWDLFMEILSRVEPDGGAFAREIFTSNLIHPCNINIFRSELYREYWEWAFPIMDEFYRRSPEKTDRYQHRDVGFIAERLSHLFVMKKQAQGCRVEEVLLQDLASTDWDCKKECDLNDFEAVYQSCNRLYREHQITKCCNVLGAAMHLRGNEDERLSRLSRILITGILERESLPLTMHEYLPEELRSDLDVLMQVYDGLYKLVGLYGKTGDAQVHQLLLEYLEKTHFSQIVIRSICEELELGKFDL